MMNLQVISEILLQDSCKKKKKSWRMFHKSIKFQIERGSSDKLVTALVLVQCCIERHWQDHRGRTSAHPIYLYRLYTAIGFSCLGAVLQPCRFQKLPQ